MKFTNPHPEKVEINNTEWKTTAEGTRSVALSKQGGEAPRHQGARAALRSGFLRHDTTDRVPGNVLSGTMKAPLPLSQQCSAKIGYILLWLLGVPLPVLAIIYLIWG